MTETTEIAPVSPKRLNRQRAADALYFGVIGLWIGLYVASGVAAGMIFKVARELGAQITAGPYARLPIADPDALAGALAGHQFGAVFDTTSGVMALLAVITLCAFGWRGGLGHWHGVMKWVAGLVLVGAVTAFAYSKHQAGVVAGLQTAYYDAVLAQSPQAPVIRGAFDAAHEASAGAGKASLLCLVLLFAVSMVPTKAKPEAKSETESDAAG